MIATVAYPPQPQPYGAAQGIIPVVKKISSEPTEHRSRNGRNMI